MRSAYVLRVRRAAFLFFCSALVCAASNNVEGRWEGSVQIPGRAYALIVDLDPAAGVEAATGQPVLKQPDKCYMFSSPAIASDVVFIGVLNGTLQARDRKSGEMLWNFETEISQQNKSSVLTSGRSFNISLLYHSNRREAPLVALDQQPGIGAVYSSPLIVNGVVSFGSTDGYLYALE